MKRPFRGFEVLGLAAALAGAGACTPNNSVKPGAPVLIEVSIVEGGGATITSIPPSAPVCAAGTVSGGACFTATDKTCFLTKNWCRCGAAPAAPMPMPAPTCTDGGVADAGAAGSAGGAAGAG
ncbi:MAG TPA: hypothetical protein VHO67_09090, partial [Polyangia bacterium]|nr:hypothetical protein [Polyangia bacterium]